MFSGCLARRSSTRSRMGRQSRGAWHFFTGSGPEKAPFRGRFRESFHGRGLYFVSFQKHGILSVGNPLLKCRFLSGLFTAGGGFPGSCGPFPGSQWGGGCRRKEYRRFGSPRPAPRRRRTQCSRPRRPYRRRSEASWRRPEWCRWGWQGPCPRCPGRSRGWARRAPVFRLPGRRREGNRFFLVNTFSLCDANYSTTSAPVKRAKSDVLSRSFSRTGPLLPGLRSVSGMRKIRATPHNGAKDPPKPAAPTQRCCLLRRRPLLYRNARVAL